MSTFTEEMQRRLRAVLSLRVQAPLPSDIPVEMWALLADADDADSPRLLAIGTPVPPYAQWNYEEPGAWEKLLADLEAIPDEPTASPGTVIDGTEVAPAYRLLAGGNADNGVYVATVESAPATPPLAFVRAERLTGPAVSQWWAWDELGTKYILTFIHGVGTVCVARTGETWPPVRQFEQGTSSHITLDAFAGYAGIDVSQIPEEQRR